MNKAIQKIIIWYLNRHNVKFDRDGYVVRMFSADYYGRLMWYAQSLNSPNCRCSIYPVFEQEENHINP